MVDKTSSIFHFCQDRVLLKLLFICDLRWAFFKKKNWYSYMYTYISFACFSNIQTEMSIMFLENKLIKYRNIITECRDSSKSILSWFYLFSPQRCFTFMDRGFVFKQINNYISCFAPGDPKVLSVFKQAIFKCCLFLMHGDKVLH